MQYTSDPGRLFERIRTKVKEQGGGYFSELMEVERTTFLGRERYERIHGWHNHRNVSYGRRLTLKGIGEVAVKIPRDRHVEFRTDVIPTGQTVRRQLAERSLRHVLDRSKYPNPGPAL